MERKRKKNNSHTNFVGLFLFIFFLVPVLGGFCAAAFEVSDLDGLAIAVAVMVLIVIIGVVYIIISHSKQAGKLRAICLDHIDNMQGVEFENYVKALLTHRGFAVETTKASGDLGVDLVARGPEGSIAIQVKRQRSQVSRRAVSDAVAGMAHYHCKRAMVVTNNYFTPGAKGLAMSNRCELVDRDILTHWIMDFQSGTRKSGG